MIALLAQSAAAPAAGPAGIAGMLTPMLLVFAVFYFLLIRPQQKQQKQQQAMIAGINTNDQVITRSGIHGKITAVDTSTVQLEIAPNVRITLSKDQIAGLAAKPADKTAKAA